MMNKHIIKALLLIVIAAALPFKKARAQKKIAIDTVTKLMDPIPFDQYFYFELKDANNSIDRIDLFQISGYKGQMADSDLRSGLLFNKVKKLKSPQLIHKQNKAVVQVPPLKPNRSIVMNIVNKFKGEMLNALLELFAIMHSGKPAEINSKWGQFNKTLSNEVVNHSFNVFWFDSVKFVRKFDESLLLNLNDSLLNVNDRIRRRAMQGFYNNHVRPIFDQIQNINPNLAGLSLDSNSHSVKKVLQFAEKWKKSAPCCDEENLVDNLHYLYKILSLDSVARIQMINKLLLGYVSLTRSSQFDLTGVFNIPERIRYLKESIVQIEATRNELLNISIKDSGALQKDIVSIYEMLNSIDIQITNSLQSIGTFYNSLIALIDNERGLRYSNIFIGNNNVIGLKTAGSYQVIPDVGLAAVYADGYYDDRCHFLPYLGVSVYLRPINKDIPFRLIDKSYFQRFSFNVGVTTVPLLNNDEFSDLYKNMSLLLGANYKLYRPVAVSAGVMLARLEDENPLISDKRTVPMPYISFAMDLDFINGAKQLISKFGL